MTLADINISGIDLLIILGIIALVCIIFRFGPRL